MTARAALIAAGAGAAYAGAMFSLFHAFAIGPVRDALGFNVQGLDGQPTLRQAGRQGCGRNGVVGDLLAHAPIVSGDGGAT